jgi:hypothetical protein
MAMQSEKKTNIHKKQLHTNFSFGWRSNFGFQCLSLLASRERRIFISLQGVHPGIAALGLEGVV